MGTITLTAAMRANLLSLQRTGSDLSSTQLKLATGNKVNSALDSPVNFFAAQALNRRASQLSALLDGMGQAIQTIQTANQGLTAITGLVNQLTSIANSATQNLTSGSTQNILSATTAVSGMSSATVANIGGTAGTLVLTPSSGNQAAFSIVAAETLQTLINQINATEGFTAIAVQGTGQNTLPNGVTMTAGLTYLQITSTNGATISTAGSTAGVLTTLGLGAASASYATGVAADGTNYANVVAQINALASNSSYQGNNLINGTGANVTVQINENSTTPITINSVSATVTGLGIQAALGTTAGTIATAITAINAALTTLQTQASGFANSLSMIQNRQDFASNLINTLESGATSLTIADKNEEGANLLALQTQQQLGIEALSLSSQANQSVLRLFS
jgi:flagellin